MDSDDATTATGDCEDPGFDVRASSSVDTGTWPPLRRAGFTEWHVDAECVFTREAVSDSHVYHFDCTDAAGETHTIAVGLDVSPPGYPTFETGEALHLAHFSTQPSSFHESTVIRDPNGTIRLVAYRGDPAAGSDEVDSSPLVFEVIDQACPPAVECGAPERAALLARTAADSVVVFDHQQSAASFDGHPYIVTVEAAQHRAGGGECTPDWTTAAQFVLADEG